MKKKHLQIPLFALFVSVVVAYAYFIEFKGEEKEQEQSRILQVDSLSIAKIFLTRSDNEENQIVLEKQPSQSNNEDGMEDQSVEWRITKPYDDVADSSVISSFVESLVQETSNIKIPIASSANKGESDSADGESSVQEGMEKYGLDNPLGSFQVILQDDTQMSVRVGRVEGLNSKTYLFKTAAEEDIWVGSSWWRTQLEKKPDEFRSKKVMDFDNVERLTLTQRGDFQEKVLSTEVLEFLKTESGWSFNGEKRDTVEGYLQKLKDLRVESFEDEEAIDYDKWVLNITVQEADQAEDLHHLKVAPIEGDNAYVFTSPRQLAVKVSKASVEVLINGIEDLKRSPQSLLSNNKSEGSSADSQETVSVPEDASEPDSQNENSKNEK